MVPGFLHCCILTERNKCNFFLLKAAHLKRWLYTEQTLKAKTEYLAPSLHFAMQLLISLKITSLSKSVQIEVCDQAAAGL